MFLTAESTVEQKEKKFVIQEHTNTGGIHWDFMLESGDSLQTYRLENSPKDMLIKDTNGEKIFDHQLKFLTYQGPVNNGSGNVTIAESGTYRIISQNERQIELSLKGRILNGKCILTRNEDGKWCFAVKQC